MQITEEERGSIQINSNEIRNINANFGGSTAKRKNKEFKMKMKKKKRKKKEKKSIINTAMRPRLITSCKRLPEPKNGNLPDNNTCNKTPAPQMSHPFP